MATTVQGWKAVEQVMRELGYPYSVRWLRTLAKDPPKGCSLLPVFAIGRRGRRKLDCLSVVADGSLQVGFKSVVDVTITPHRA